MKAVKIMKDTSRSDVRVMSSLKSSDVIQVNKYLGNIKSLNLGREDYVNSASKSLYFVIRI